MVFQDKSERVIIEDTWIIRFILWRDPDSQSYEWQLNLVHLEVDVTSRNTSSPWLDLVNFCTRYMVVDLL